MQSSRNYMATINSAIDKGRWEGHRSEELLRHYCRRFVLPRQLPASKESRKSEWISKAQLASGFLAVLSIKKRDKAPQNHINLLGHFHRVTDHGNLLAINLKVSACLS